MSFPICDRCAWKGNVTYCHWCTNSQKNGIHLPGFKPNKTPEGQQRLDTFLEAKG